MNVINPEIKILINKANSTRSVILPNGSLISLDTGQTHRNNNIVCIGGSGTGKTCSLVEPNLIAAVDSYILSDPKGSPEKIRDVFTVKGLSSQACGFHSSGTV